MPTNTEKASPTEVRAFFESDGGPKLDPEGYDQIARGIKDGTLTY